MMRAVRIACLFGLAAAACASAQDADNIFDTGHLHDIYLSMPGADWQTLRDNYLEDTKYDTAFRWNEFEFTHVKVRSRGSSSRDPVKPSLKIDFDGVDKSQRFGKMKSLVLDNNIQDPSLVKERIVMGLFAALRLPAPRVSLGKLFVNGSFAGVYSITEPVDDVFLERYFGESRGYLYEYNAIEPYYLTDLGDDPAQYIPERFEPKTRENDPQPQPLIDFIRALNHTASTEFAGTLETWTDTEMLLKYLAAEQYISEVDGINGWNGINNFYLYQSEQPVKFTFIAWDKDATFNFQSSVFNNFEQNPLTASILENRDLLPRYLALVQEIAAAYGEPGGWLEREFEFAVHQVRPAAKQDPTLQCSDFDDQPRPCGDAEGRFEQEVQRIREFIQQRNAVVYSHMNDAQREVIGATIFQH